MDNEERGVSIAEIFKVIFKRVWWVVGVTAACLLVFVLVIQLWYNRNNEVYTVGYTLSFPGISEGTYPDGSTYRYNSAVTLESLTDVVSSNSEFSGIDISNMVAEDDIAITRQANVIDEANNVTEMVYVLSVKAKYFTDEDQAVDFVRAVVSYPVTHAAETVAQMDHKVNLQVYDSPATDSFSGKISALNAQRNYILGRYDEMSSGNNGGMVSYSEDGRTLVDKRADAESVFGSSDQSYINALINSEHYVYDYERFLREYDATLADLERRMSNNNSIITATTEARDALIQQIGSNNVSQADLEPFNSIIAQYTAENASLQNQINDLKYTYGEISVTESAEHAAFVEGVNKVTSMLNAFRDELETATEEVTEVYNNYFLENCYVAYDSNTISLEGGMNIILAAVLGAVIGFVVVSVVICIIDMPKYLRSRDAANREQKSEEEKQ